MVLCKHFETLFVNADDKLNIANHAQDIYLKTLFIWCGNGATAKNRNNIEMRSALVSFFF